MKLKARLLIPALAIAALLLVATVGVVAAQTATTTPTPTPTQEKPRDQVLDRAAQILGVDKSKLQDALQQATTETRRERQDQAAKARLDKLVENGKLTQEEAGSVYTWFQSRPDAAVGLMGRMMAAHRGQGRAGIRMHGRFGPPPAQQPAPQTQTPTSF